MRKHILMLSSLLLPTSLWAVDSLYCSANHGTIKVGMTEQQVIQACGKPIATKKSNNPPTRKVPVTQYIFNNQGTSTAFYGVWNIQTGSGGVQLEVDVLNNKVISARVNGSDSNGFSVCGVNIQVGDSESTVLNNCGNPAMVNQTYVDEDIPGIKNTVLWLYQQGQYTQPFTLTFTDGKLQSINQ